MNIQINVDLSGMKVEGVLNKVDSNEVGIWAIKEWHRLLIPFTPSRNGLLVRNITIEPWKVTYNQPYAAYVYRGEKYIDPQYKKGGFTDGNIFWSRKGISKIPSGEDLVFRKDGTGIYASKEWDKAAINAGKDKDLANSVAKFIKMKIGG